MAVTFAPIGKRPPPPHCCLRVAPLALRFLLCLSFSLPHFFRLRALRLSSCCGAVLAKHHSAHTNVHTQLCDSANKRAQQLGAATRWPTCASVRVLPATAAHAITSVPCAFPSPHTTPSGLISPLLTLSLRLPTCHIPLQLFHFARHTHCTTLQGITEGYAGMVILRKY